MFYPKYFLLKDIEAFNTDSAVSFKLITRENEIVRKTARGFLPETCQETFFFCILPPRPIQRETSSSFLHSTSNPGNSSSEETFSAEEYRAPFLRHERNKIRPLLCRREQVARMNSNSQQLPTTTFLFQPGRTSPNSFCSLSYRAYTSKHMATAALLFCKAKKGLFYSQRQRLNIEKFAMCRSQTLESYKTRARENVRDLIMKPGPSSLEIGISRRRH